MNQLKNSQLNALSELAELKRIHSSLNVSSGDLSKCIMVTSAMRGEGKTFISAGLAVIAAKYDKKTVLAVDLNWYRPRLHTYFGLDQDFDAYSFYELKSLSPFVRKSGINHLDILPAPLRPQGDANSPVDNFKLALAVIEQASATYDYVVLDTSPVFPTNRHMVDPVVVGKGIDKAVVVTLANVTSRHTVKKAYVALQSAGVNVCGFIVNNMKVNNI